jgi:hypothetical protein
MKELLAADVFKPTPTRSESKSEMIDRAAKEIIASQAADDFSKTARLRAERLAHEAALKAATPVVEKEKPKRRIKINVA